MTVVKLNIKQQYLKRFNCMQTNQLVARLICMNAWIPQIGCLGVVWLTWDQTKKKGKCISLNSDFIEWILHKRYRCRNHGCCMLKVYVAESLRLSCLLVCINSVSKRWGWSPCLVQILGVAVWLGRMCCWRWSMTWMHWWEKLNDQCPGCTVLWFNQRGVEVALMCWY